MRPRLLLDTHVLNRWLIEPKKLSKEQHRTLETAIARGEAVGLSAMSLIEIAVLASLGRLDVDTALYLDDIGNHPLLAILPITPETAKDVFRLDVLKDPADRTIVATARVHRLRLLTSDPRIIDSKLVPVVE